MRSLILLFCIFSFVNCKTKETKLNGNLLLEKSSKYHDKNNEWNKANFTIHIQEPRVGNPYRYSIVTLNNEENTFELQRNRDKHISTHKVTQKGSITLLDGEIITDSLQIKKYRLEPKRNKRYQRFYKTLLGLPMSLTNEIKEIGETKETIFNAKESYKIPLELHEPLFSKHWILYISKKENKIIGLEMVFPEDTTKGERLIFEGEFKLGNVILPRMRHWKELTNEYSGSDIILKSVD